MHRRILSKTEADSFDTERFVDDEVEKRPTIWDMTSQEYSIKISKRRHSEIIEKCLVRMFLVLDKE